MKKFLLLLLALLLINFISACKKKNHLEDENQIINTDRVKILNGSDSEEEISTNILEYSKTANSHPIIFNFNISNENKSRLYFDSSKPITASNTTGFTVSGKTISGITINQGSKTGHYFTLSSAFDFWDNNTIRYEGGSNITDLSSNDLHNFTLQYITNNIDEPRATTNSYYVATTGSDDKNGTSESTAWATIGYALSQVTAGSTVWIKAGNYGDENITMMVDGTAANPIKIIGYKSAIRDITSMYYTYARGVGLDISEMPTLTGASAGIGLNIQSDYVIYRNLQFTNYDRMFINEQGGVNVGVVANIIDNCIGYKNSYYAEGNGNIIGFKGMTSSNNRLINSIAVNTTMLAFSLRGYFSLAENNKAYADDLIDSSDYYFDIKGGDNIVRRNLAHQTYDNTHGGHGIALKSRAIDNNEKYVWRSEYTLIEDNDVINIQQAVHLSHKETKNNVVRNIRITNPDAYSSVIGISFLGSSNNIAENLTYDSDKGEAIKFTSSNEDLIYTYGANNNIVKNSIFTHGSVIVRVDEFDTARNIFDNKILNCTFFDFYYLEDNDAAKGKHTGNELINCIIDQCRVLKANKGNPLYTTQSYSSFKDLGFSTPGGTGNIIANPLFADQINFKPKNPKLKSGLPLSEVHYDRNKTERENPPTMGASELRVK